MTEENQLMNPKSDISFWTSCYAGNYNVRVFFIAFRPSVKEVFEIFTICTANYIMFIYFVVVANKKMMELISKLNLIINKLNS